jgi:hypothetical protein
VKFKLYVISGPAAYFGLRGSPPDRAIIPSPDAGACDCPSITVTGAGAGSS